VKEKRSSNTSGQKEKAKLNKRETTQGPLLGPAEKITHRARPYAEKRGIGRGKRRDQGNSEGHEGLLLLKIRGKSAERVADSKKLG